MDHLFIGGPLDELLANEFRLNKTVYVNILGQIQ